MGDSYGLELTITVISRWFGKFKKLTTGKRNLHFIEIKGFGKKSNVLATHKFVCIQVVIFNLSLDGDDFTIIKKDLYLT